MLNNHSTKNSKISPNSPNPKNVIWLGITSLFTDISSEMIFPVLPIFLKTVLGAPFWAIGLIEGIAEGLSSFLKYFAGKLSDFTQKRKNLTVLGYGLSAVSKILFAMAFSWPMVLFSRALDRFGKGIRTSPRDALINESVNPQDRGKFFGLHRTLDTVGAFLGTLIAALLLYFLNQKQTPELIEKNIRLIFSLSFLPALIGLLILIFFVKETKKEKTANSKFVIFQYQGFSKRFYLALLILGIFSLGNLSFAFLILKTQKLGFSLFLIPLLYLLYNFFYAFTAYPAGKISDKIGRVKILGSGILTLALVFAGFALFQQKFFLIFLFILYGVAIGLTDSVSKAFVADLSQKEKTGESFGLFYLVTGLTALFGNLIGGFLSDKINLEFAFAFAAFLTALSGFLMAIFFKSHQPVFQNYGPENFKGYR
jgi:MFS family permease